MPRINIEDELFKDRRFLKLIHKNGPDEALGMLISAWIVGQRYWKHSDNGIPKTEWVKQELRNEIIEVGLAEDRGDFVFITGSEKHFGWVRERSEAGKLGAAKTNKKKSGSAERSRGSAQQTPASPSFSPSPSSSLSNSSSKKEDSPPPAVAVEGQVVPPLEPVRSVILERNVSIKVQKLWLETYPDAPWVVRQIRAAVLWEMTKGRRKIKFDRFMSNWLARDWDRRPAPSQNQELVIPARSSSGRASADAFAKEMDDFVAKAMENR